ncbi:Cof-type HAD-IIB family hydrolase [Flavobacterium sp. UMI-01]|uniref:Cof-type HAD-IIB family hydrolase n=1 Tax=Flavobacterium sp. UMI-01 TaxID=1441053 RepID=UPI001C7D1AFD|nr:Cof-type HAD-IIB family hydrolase [Flavobacterium sp. UMI-01]GIZ08292.1 hydrolase [Flavobacterium sp. UMI-01]
MEDWSNVKVIITDLDGTLLNPSHTISDYSQKIFRTLHERGYLIIVATGRHHLDAMPLVEPLGFPVYLVTSNGARIHNPHKELLFSFDIASETIKSIIEIGIPDEFTTVLYKETVWQTNKHNEKLNNFQPEMNYKPELVDFNTLEDFSTIKLFFTHEEHTKLVALRDQILEKHAQKVVSAFSLPHCLEFMDTSVDKCVAIAKILALENYNFEQTIAFGDGFNDEKMLVAAYKGMIMGNAPESLKNKLAHLEVIDTNAMDGVAQFLFDKLVN